MAGQTIPCPNCDHEIPIEEIQGGTSVVCPACGATFNIERSGASDVINMLDELDDFGKNPGNSQ